MNMNRKEVIKEPIKVFLGELYVFYLSLVKPISLDSTHFRYIVSKANINELKTHSTLIKYVLLSSNPEQPTSKSVLNSDCVSESLKILQRLTSP